MKKQIVIMGILSSIVGLFGCTEKKTNNDTTKIETSTEQTKNIVDISKREKLVEKYNLLNFPDIKQPVLMTLDEFFDGNSDEASIAPNFTDKPAIETYYKTLKELSTDKRTLACFAELKDVMLYDGKLHDNEWFYTDIIYFVGDFTKEEIKLKTKNLMPDEVEYDKENKIEKFDDKYKGKKVVYLWWD